MYGKPPLDLHAEVTLANGTRYRWDSSSKAGDIPQGISFRTKKGDGFADASVTLSRRIDQDYVDLNLYDDFALVGYDGSVAYEGRVAANPRSLSTQHQMAVVLQGWMSHAKDRKFTEIYVDRDLSRWSAPSLQRQGDLATLGYGMQDFRVASDAGGLAGIVETIRGAWNTKPDVEALYDAGAANVGAVWYDFTKNANISVADTNWEWYVQVRSDDGVGLGLSGGTTANLRAASGSGYLTATTPYRFALLQLLYNAAGAAGTEGTDYAVTWRNPAVYGNHGLTRQGTDPGGFYASDVIANVISRFCPKLNTAGVQATTYAIPHLVFNRAFPYDALLEINKFHLWNLAVYENKSLIFEPFDYTDYDWEIRLSDPGVTVDLQGDSVGEFANGIAVIYPDVNTGRTEVITPDNDSTLADTSVTNPANTHGLTVWTEISLTSPTTATAAVQIGRAALAEFNQPKAPGTIHVTGHVRDRAGHYQPVWKVRAGDRLIISDHPNDRVRLVNETDYQHDSKTVSIAVDSSFMRLDAVIDRVSAALQAANL